MKERIEKLIAKLGKGEQVTICCHNTNDSKGTYCLRVDWFDSEDGSSEYLILLGIEAVEALTAISKFGQELENNDGRVW